MINPVGRPRKISNDNLNAIKKMVIAKKLSVKKVSIIKGFKYGSVIAAANALNHSLRSVVKVYAIRATV